MLIAQGPGAWRGFVAEGTNPQRPHGRHQFDKFPRNKPIFIKILSFENFLSNFQVKKVYIFILLLLK
jgi:hypothetical protein